MKSKKPKKQRRKYYKAKLHERGKQICCLLSKALRKEVKKRSLPLRKGDKVRVMRGGHKKASGKVARINRSKRQVFIEKVTRKKADGTEILIPFKASNLMITELELKDSRRVKRAKIKIQKKETEEKKKEAKQKNEEPKRKEEAKKEGK